MDFNHVLQINDKGQLRLSHRALLPDADPDNSNSTDKGSLEEVISLTNAGLVGEKTEQNAKVNTRKGKTSSKRSSEDNSVLPSKKFTRRSVSSSDNEPVTNKDKIKKSGNKDESNLVSEEA